MPGGVVHDLVHFWSVVYELGLVIQSQSYKVDSVYIVDLEALALNGDGHQISIIETLRWAVVQCAFQGIEAHNKVLAISLAYSVVKTS